MDADLSHEPKEIPKILEVLNKAFVIGSRYIKVELVKCHFLEV